MRRELVGDVDFKDSSRLLRGGVPSSFGMVDFCSESFDKLERAATECSKKLRGSLEAPMIVCDGTSGDIGGLLRLEEADDDVVVLLVVI